MPSAKYTARLDESNDLLCGQGYVGEGLDAVLLTTFNCWCCYGHCDYRSNAVLRKRRVAAHSNQLVPSRLAGLREQDRARRFAQRPEVDSRCTAGMSKLSF